MRIRTLLTLTTGAAFGAGAMYLLDPEHGPQRRQVARRQAMAWARENAVHSAGDVRRRAEEVAVAALAGYREAREAGTGSS